MRQRAATRARRGKTNVSETVGVAAGIDVDRARSAGALTWLDARELLGTFMRGGTPDRERFMASLDALLEQSRRGDPHADVCAYGEMVDLLWKDGNADGAILLEAICGHHAHVVPTERYTEADADARLLRIALLEQRGRPRRRRAGRRASSWR